MAFKRKPPPGNMRRVRSQGSNLCGVTTNKRGRLVQFESEQERKLILLLERDATVTDYVSQPETLHYCDSSGRQRTYTPDFQVWRIDRQIELHEVTIEARRQSSESIPMRETAAQTVCQQRGWSYHVHTEQSLPSGGEYANLNCLSPFRARIYTSPPVTAWWLHQLTNRGPIHPLVVLPQEAVSELLNGLYHLLWHNQIAMDWRHSLFQNERFSPTASIWLPHPLPVTSRDQQWMENEQGGPL